MLIKILMLVIFFGAMVGIGFYCRSQATDVNGFVLGGRSVGPWLTAFAYGTSYFSAVVFVGYAGQFGWKYGIAATWAGIGNALIGSLMAWAVLGRRTRILTQHLDSATMPEFFGRRFGSRSLKLAASVITFIFLIMAVLFIILSKNTKYGKSVYAVGSNEKSARLAGINVTWVKISVFILTGICVGVASLLQACKIGNVTPASSGVSYEMYAIAAVVLAGVNMAGGKGNLVGVIFGALSYTTINFIIVSIPGLSVDIQDTFQGLVLIVVILIQTVGPVIKENIQRAKKRKLMAQNK